MSRIAVGGFFHETNTFSPSPGDLAAFRRGGTMPGLTIGEEIDRQFHAFKVPAAGAIACLRAHGHEVVSTAYASAVPCGTVTAEAFETVGGAIVDGIARAGALDGVYLDLHGAMVTQAHEDAEAELIERVRKVVGPRVPIAASFDLHANLTADTVRPLAALTIFQTYPHVDMVNTGTRAAELLHRRLARARPFVSVVRKLPFLIPLHVQCTDAEPAAGIYAEARRLANARDAVAVEFAFGFPPADIRDCGPALVVTAENAQAADAIAAEFEAFVCARERDFAVPLLSPRAAVREAERLYSGRPVVIADTQDNPGAGGTSDTVGLLHALIDERASDAVLAILHDPPAARQAHALGVGRSATFRVGGHSGAIAEAPVVGEFVVEALGDGRFVATGPMYGGNRFDIGATALLRQGGVRVIVAERRLQAADTSILRHVGLDPAALRTIVLKSTVHFRADFAPLAGAILVAVAPGLHLADNAQYDYRRLRPDVRRMPAA
ncbi:MAG: M81 family metallopeptidase [Acidobacteria bacterium]|nr:M81 family metallopeptidase [Acidobacteriota bacterium]